MGSGIALGSAAAFLSLAILTTALVKRWRAARVVRVPVQGMDPVPRTLEPPAEAKR